MSLFSAYKRKVKPVYIKGQRTSLDTTIRKIESMFYREREIRKAVSDVRQDCGNGGHTGGGGHAYVSDPTAINAIKGITPIKSVTLFDGVVVRHPEKWLAVIDATYNNLDDLQRKAVKMRYQGKTYNDINEKVHISRTVYYAMLTDARNFAIAAACQINLIRVF